MNGAKKKTTFIVILLMLLLQSSVVGYAEDGVFKVDRMDSKEFMDTFEYSCSFNDQALGNIGNLTLTNKIDRPVNLTLVGLEGYIIVASQNRTILGIIGVIAGVHDGVVSYFPSKFVIFDPSGGEKSTLTLVVYGFCIGPYDIPPESGELAVVAPAPVDTPDSFQTTTDIVKYTNTLNYPDSFSELDTLLSRSVLFFALTDQNVTPKGLKHTYSRFDVDSIITFVDGTLTDYGIDTSKIPALTYGTSDVPVEPSNPPNQIPGFPLITVLFSLMLVSSLKYMKTHYN